MSDSPDVNGIVETPDDLQNAVEALRERMAPGSKALQTRDNEDRHSLSVPDDISDRLPAPYRGAAHTARELVGQAPDFGDLTPPAWREATLPEDYSPLPILAAHADFIHAAQMVVAQRADEARQLRQLARNAEDNGRPASAWELNAHAVAHEQGVARDLQEINAAIKRLAFGMGYDNFRRFVEVAPELADPEIRGQFLHFCGLRWPGVAPAGACKRDLRVAWGEFVEATGRSASPAARRQSRRSAPRGGTSIADEARSHLGSGPTSWSQKAEALARVLGRRGIT